jgi:hypothetical protein
MMAKVVMELGTPLEGRQAYVSTSNIVHKPAAA